MRTILERHSRFIRVHCSHVKVNCCSSNLNCIPLCECSARSPRTRRSSLSKQSRIQSSKVSRRHNDDNRYVLRENTVRTHVFCMRRVAPPGQCSACYYAFTPPLTWAVLRLWPWLLVYDKRKWRGGFFLLLWCLHAFLDRIGISREHTENECAQWFTRIIRRERNGVWGQDGNWVD
jgi:hypothetical protein